MNIKSLLLAVFASLCLASTTFAHGGGHGGGGHGGGGFHGGGVGVRGGYGGGVGAIGADYNHVRRNPYGWGFVTVANKSMKI